MRALVNHVGYEYGSAAGILRTNSMWTNLGTNIGSVVCGSRTANTETVRRYTLELHNIFQSYFSVYCAKNNGLTRTEMEGKMEKIQVQERKGARVKDKTVDEPSVAEPIVIENVQRGVKFWFHYETETLLEPLRQRLALDSRVFLVARVKPVPQEERQCLIVHLHKNCGSTHVEVLKENLQRLKQEFELLQAHFS